jgi:hypothetical protein
MKISTWITADNNKNAATVLMIILMDALVTRWVSRTSLY